MYYFKLSNGTQLPFIPSSLYIDVITECHLPPSTGHQGIKKTYALLKSLCYFPHMRSKVEDYVKACPSCQAMKSFNQRQYGLYKPIPMTAIPFRDISMDILSSLPSIQGYDSLFVCVDRFSKMCHIAPIYHSINA